VIKERQKATVESWTIRNSLGKFKVLYNEGVFEVRRAEQPDYETLSGSSFSVDLLTAIYTLVASEAVKKQEL
jgi:hypothetical protein